MVPNNVDNDGRGAQSNNGDRAEPLSWDGNGSYVYWLTPWAALVLFKRTAANAAASVSSRSLPNGAGSAEFLFIGKRIVTTKNNVLFLFVEKKPKLAQKDIHVCVSCDN